MKILANDGISASGINQLENSGFEVITEKDNQSDLIEFINNQKIEVWGTDINSIIYTVILQFFVFIFIYKTYFAKIKKDFSFLSRLSKVIMILGIFSILFFTKNFI